MLGTLIAFMYSLSQLIFYVILAHAILSWVFVLGIGSPRQAFLGRLWEVLSSILEPFYAPIRRYVPPLGNLDSAPLVLILAIMLLQTFLRYIAYSL